MEQTQLDEYYMRLALEEAMKAARIDEVPIGAVLVYEGEVIAKAHNRREHDQHTFSHAECVVIREGNAHVGSWRLEECTLYVTLEPCPMCAGALLQAGVPRVVFGARDPKAGATGSLYNLLDDERFNHRSEVIGGVLENECGTMLSSFFKELRERKKRNKH
ncbi:LOW QUALITY PROTEIN: tRNA-specific adenosine-34 deaminase [Geomicrobium sp. JCM 19039]|nr:LOW QUALITY PROTEIN: tRNA-specific adenosine-34 deaminase [Geomicrobium sp. JCM 19039]